MKSGNRDAVRWLLISALAVILAGAGFSSVAIMIWPVHEPVWVLRVSSAGLQGGMLLAAIGASVWVLRRRGR
jgi:uncharacterized membrane protein YqjE